MLPGESEHGSPPVRPATFLPARPTPAWKLWLCGVGALAALGMAGLLFLVQILVPPERAPSFVVSLGGILSFVFLALGALVPIALHFRLPHRVDLGPQGLRLTSFLRQREIPWPELGWLEVHTTGGGLLGKVRQVAVFVAPQGRRLGSVSDHLAGFDVLVERVRQQLGEAAERSRRDSQIRKLRRSAWLTWTTAVVLAAMVVTIAIGDWRQRRNATALANDGLLAEARVERHHVHFVTPRVDVVLELDGRTIPHSAALTQEAWDALEGHATATVRYLPSNPEVIEIAEGELDLDLVDGPFVIVLQVAGAAMVLFLFWLGRLQHGGGNLHLDPESRRWRIVRVDEEP